MSTLGTHQIDDSTWMRFAAILLWKLAGAETPVSISKEDIDNFAQHYGVEDAPAIIVRDAPGGDRLEFEIIADSQARLETLGSPNCN